MGDELEKPEYAKLRELYALVPKGDSDAPEQSRQPLATRFQCAPPGQGYRSRARGSDAAAADAEQRSRSGLTPTRGPTQESEVQDRDGPGHSELGR